MNQILAIALLFLCGHILGRLMELVRAPALTGYILAGFLLGPPATNLIKAEFIQGLGFIGVIALGFIAFIIGGRIEIKELSKLKQNIIFLTVFQVLATFFVVFVGTYLISRSFPISMLLAAISSATAPASVFAVIEQFKAKGPLTDTLLAVVAIDDAICVILFGLVIAITWVLAGGGFASILENFIFAFYEVLGSLGLGALIGLGVTFIINKAKYVRRVIFVIVGLVLLGCGLSIALEMSALLTNMMAGFIIINISFKARETFNLVEKIEEPILILFFTLAGAHLYIRLIPELGLLILGYIFFRGCGKVFGGMLAAKINRAPEVIRRYIGLCLLPQAGMAVGLLYAVRYRMPEFSLVITTVVLASIVINEIIGPIGVEVALLESKEGRRDG